MGKLCIIRANSVCSRRTMDYLDIVRYAKANGLTVLPKNQIDFSEFGCLVTCGSTEGSNTDSLAELNYMKKYIPEEKIIVLGCISATIDGFRDQFNGKAVAPIDYVTEIDQAFIDIGVINTLYMPYKEMSHSTEDFFELMPYFSPRHWFLFVSAGCKGACKYCRIKSAVGNLKSESLDNIIQSLTKGIEKGYEIFWPSGDDLGAYGIDIGETFPTLVNKLIERGEQLNIPIKFDIRTVIDSRYLVRYERELLRILQNKPKSIISLGVGLQSAIPRLLKLSNRYHELGKIQDFIVKSKKINNDLFMPAHLIVGLPTETIEETIQTFQFIERSPIDLWVCSKYSHLKGTRFYNEYGGLFEASNKNYDVFKSLVDSSSLYCKQGADGSLYVMRESNDEFFALN